MKKFKKIALMALSAVLLVAVAIGGTVAYLSSEDGAVNVMTVGNVKIEQHRFEREVKADGSYATVYSEKYKANGYKLKEYTQAKPLLPAVGAITGYAATPVYFDQLGAGASGGQQVLDGLENVQDSFVLVKNTGKFDAYLRTLVAYEIGSIPVDQIDSIIELSDSAAGNPYRAEDIGVITVDGNNYYLIEYIYTGFSTGNPRHNGGILPAGEWSYASLNQFYLKPATTNEDIEMLDGNANGLFDVLIVSQACQVDGFENCETALDTAFYDVTVTSHPWTEAQPVIRLAADANTLDDVLAQIKNDQAYWNKNIELYLAEGTYDDNYSFDQYPRWNGFAGAGNSQNNMPVLAADEAYVNITVIGNSNTVFTGNVYINGFGNSNAGFDASHAYTTFKGVTFDGANSADETKPEDSVVVYVLAAATDVTFEDCTFKNATHVTVGGGNPNSVRNVAFKGCTFDNGGCISGDVKNSLIVTDCVVNNEGGFINLQNTTTISVKNTDVTCGKYFLRTNGSAIKMTVRNGAIAVNEFEGERNLVNFRGAGHSATFIGCEIQPEYNTAGVGSKGTLTIK